MEPEEEPCGAAVREVFEEVIRDLWICSNKLSTPKSRSSHAEVKLNLHSKGQNISRETIKVGKRRVKNGYDTAMLLKIFLKKQLTCGSFTA